MLKQTLPLAMTFAVIAAPLVSGAQNATTVDDGSAQIAALAADPESAAMMATAQPNTPPTGSWDESATRDYYNSILHLAWQKTFGDYFPTPIGSATIPDIHARETVNIPVVGNNFFLANGGGGNAFFDSREGPASYRPMLIVNGKTKYTATRDTYLTASSSRSQNGSLLLDDRRSILIAFDGYAPKAGDHAVLQLTSEKQYGTHKLTAYAPDVHSVFPVIDATVNGTIVKDIRGPAYRAAANLTIDGDVVTGAWGGRSGTAISQLFKLPPANEYFLTVVIRLHDDFPNWGGKLPGIGDTGQATNTGGVPLIIDGVNCDNSGWGGRSANGCRWSARTGWSGRSGNQVGLHTYYYAQSPQSGWGEALNWQTPATVGQWFAYVERVRVNTPGQGDGRLSYWMCTEQGCSTQFDETNITWSSHDIPQAKITEAWADVYCGGTSCGPAPWPTATTDLKRMTVTVGLPDLGALAAEVKAMNAGG